MKFLTTLIYVGSRLMKLSRTLLFNNITRYIYNLKKFDHVSAFSIKIFSMSFEDLIKYRVLIFLLKIIANNEPHYLFNKLCFLTCTRHSNNLRSIRVKYLVSERQFFVFSNRLWNLLPYHFKIIRNPVRFKKDIGEYFILKYL